MIELRGYQKHMVRAEVDNSQLLVVAPMGSGKTVSSLTALATLIYRDGLTNVLIVAPKRVAMSVWAQESENYDMGLNVRYCERAVDIKLFLLEPANHRICVCSVTRIDEIPHGCWDMIIADESTLFGNKSALRSKEMRRICNKVPRRLLLTGTPIHGGYEKLWHQIFLLDGGKALGKTLSAFRQKYMQVKYQVHGVVTVWEINPAMISQLMQDVKHLIYVVTDSVKLPPLLYKNVYVDLPPQRKKEYVEFERDSIIKFHEDYPEVTEEAHRRGLYSLDSVLEICDRKTLVAFAASARGIKLRQLASGCVYVDESNKTYSVTHKEKIAALKEVVEAADRGVLVAYCFRSEYEELKKAFPEARRIEDAKDIEDWNAGRIPVALVHPASVGHGLNLQFGGDIAVWYSLTYDAELYAQFNKRIHRPGQVSDTVSILHLLARGTIDEKILNALQYKQDNANEFTKI